MAAAARVLPVILCCAAASAAELPAVDLKGANLPSGSLNLPTGGVNLPTGGVNLPAGGVNLSTYAVVQPAAKSGGELRFQLLSDVLFAFDKADLRPEADVLLRQLLAQVKEQVKAPRYRVEGHTDAKGSDDYNLDLSRRRAESVKAWLAKVGKVPAQGVATAGFGETRPVAPNTRPDGGDDPEGRQKNRRVEVVVTQAR